MCSSQCAHANGTKVEKRFFYSGQTVTNGYKWLQMVTNGRLPEPLLSIKGCNQHSAQCSAGSVSAKVCLSSSVKLSLKLLVTTLSVRQSVS